MLKKLIDKIHDWHIERIGNKHGIELPADRYHKKGLEHYEAGRYEEAMEFFKKEIEHDIEGYIGYKWMGKAMLKYGHGYGAIWHYEMAIANIKRLNKKYPGAYDPIVIRRLKKELKEMKKDADTLRSWNANI